MVGRYWQCEHFVRGQAQGICEHFVRGQAKGIG